MGSGETLLQQELGQSFDVVGALAERWDAQLELIETVEQIAAEAAVMYGLLQIQVGGGDDANVYVNLTTAAQAVVGDPVKDAQQLHLNFGVEFSDFVEEQSAVIGHLEEAGF